MKINQNSLINAGARVMMFFLKIANYLDLESSNLKVEFARDITISNNCVRIYQNPLINAGARAITNYINLFFLKKATVTLTLSPAS